MIYVLYEWNGDEPCFLKAIRAEEMDMGSLIDNWITSQIGPRPFSQGYVEWRARLRELKLSDFLKTIKHEELEYLTADIGGMSSD